jgi:hypothetical protein
MLKKKNRVKRLSPIGENMKREEVRKRRREREKIIFWTNTERTVCPTPPSLRF